MPSTKIIVDPNLPKSGVFSLDFGFKGLPVETMVDGVLGLVGKGYASKYGERDDAQEYQLPGAFNDIDDTWGRNPILYYGHAMDPILGARVIGRAIKHTLDKVGLHVEIFIPKDIGDDWQDPQAKQRFQEIYRGIKSGAIRGLSVGGSFLRVGKALLKWSMTELSVTPNPSLASATFSVGAKSVEASRRQSLHLGGIKMGDMALAPNAPTVLSEGSVGGPSASGDNMTEQNRLGILTRPDFSDVMEKAQKHKDRMLHDHLLSRPPELQGNHDSEKCPICSERRMEMGVKAVDTFNEKLWAGYKEKLVDADGRDADCFLVVEDPQKITTWHLPVYSKAGGPLNHRLMGDAWAALHEGFQGNKYEGPQKSAAISKLKKLYAQEGLDLPNSGSGGKSSENSLLYLQNHRPDLIEQAQRVIEAFEKGQKSGKKHSAKTIKTVKAAIAMLQQHFGLNDDDDDDDDDDEPDESGAYDAPDDEDADLPPSAMDS